MTNGARQCALVTGGSIRIGRVLCLALARAGWDILLHYNRSRQAAQTLAGEIEALGRRCIVTQADFMDDPKEMAARLFAAAPTPCGALIHNASLFERDESDPTGARHHAVNVAAPLALNEEFLAQLPDGTRGAIVQILDATPLPAQMHFYAQSRAEMESLLPELTARYAPRARLLALPLGPVLKNERQSEAHFAALRAAAPNDIPTTPDTVAARIMSFLNDAG